MRDVYETVIMANFEKMRERNGFENPEAVLAFLTYMERCWLGRRIANSIKHAKFPIEIWNQFDTVIAGGSRTNNSSEGSNSAWTKSLPCIASLWLSLQHSAR